MIVVSQGRYKIHKTIALDDESAAYGPVVRVFFMPSEYTVKQRGIRYVIFV